jgi:hypothetical protein
MEKASGASFARTGRGRGPWKAWGFSGCDMNTVANNPQKRQNLNFYKLLTPSEILQVFIGRTRRIGT